MADEPTKIIGGLDGVLHGRILAQAWLKQPGTLQGPRYTRPTLWKKNVRIHVAIPEPSCPHVPFEGPGVFASALANRGVSLDRVLVPQDGLPKDAGDLLIVMGGPMSVNDPARWIAEETAFIRSALRDGNPVIGVCLGSQFMAKALGARVRAGRTLELGMTPIRLTPEAKHDSVFSTVPDSLDVFEWHGEIFDLPEDCVPLAGSAAAPLQAFRYGTRAYGLLFHLEMEPAGIDALCRECASDLDCMHMTAEQVKLGALPHLWSCHQIADRLIGYLLTAPR